MQPIPPKCVRQIPSIETVSAILATKLNPARFPGMSGKMAAIVGCILGQELTKPSIAELVCTSDGCVLARRSDDIGFNEFIGSRADLDRNWSRLLDVAGLTSSERQLAVRLYRRRLSLS